MKRTACCYCRYSSDKQQQQSIDYQLEKIVAFCEKHDIELLNHYIDEATSGTNDNRDNFQRLIQDSQYAQWDYLIVYNLSRLSRNVEDQMFYQKLLRQRGVMVLSVEEKFDSSPEGDLFNLITAGINEYYSKNLAKRSFGGVLQNAKKAMVIGGVPPLGYDVGTDKKYIINEKEAQAVRIIFSKFAEGWTYAEINQYLNQNGHTTKNGTAFKHHHLDILTKRKYIGEYIFNKTSKVSSRGSRKYRDKNEDEMIVIKDGMPRIIDDITFKKVQHRLKHSRALHKKPAKLTKYLLSGTLVCGHCDYSYSGASSFPARSKKPYFYYRHANYKIKNCEYNDIKIKYLDTWILKNVIPKILNYENLKELQMKINSAIMQNKELISNQIQDLNAELKGKKIELQEKTDKIAETKMTMFILEEIKEVKKQIQALTKDIQLETKRLDSLEKITLEEMRQFVKTKREELKKIDTKENLDIFIRELVGKIEITKEKIGVFLSYDRIMNKLTAIFTLVESDTQENVTNFSKEFLKKSDSQHLSPTEYKELLNLKDEF